jgi:hypothetical protein
MRYQKPHDYSAKEQIFITVEADDTTTTFVRGNAVLWHYVDESVNFTAGNLPAYNTQGYRVIQAAGAASGRVAGFVETLPSTNGVTPNANETKPGAHFEIQVYGFHDSALIGSAAVIAGDLLQTDTTVAGALEEVAAPGNYATVGFAMEAIADTARGPILIKGVL